MLINDVSSYARENLKREMTSINKGTAQKPWCTFENQEEEKNIKNLFL